MANPAPIATYKELINLFRSICTSQLAVKQFQVGQLSDIDNQNVEHTFVRFPLVFMIPTTSSMDRFGKMLLGFSFIVMDIAKDNEEQLQIDTHNNTLMIMQDIFSKFIMTDWNTVGAKIETPIYIQPFVERFNNNLTGWSAEISVEILSPFDLCSAAFAPPPPPPPPAGDFYYLAINCDYPNNPPEVVYYPEGGTLEAGDSVRVGITGAGAYRLCFNIVEPTTTEDQSYYITDNFGATDCFTCESAPLDCVNYRLTNTGGETFTYEWWDCWGFAMPQGTLLQTETVDLCAALDSVVPSQGPTVDYTLEILGSCEPPTCNTFVLTVDSDGFGGFTYENCLGKQREITLIPANEVVTVCAVQILTTDNIIDVQDQGPGCSSQNPEAYKAVTCATGEEFYLSWPAYKDDLPPGRIVQALVDGVYICFSILELSLNPGVIAGPITVEYYEDCAACDAALPVPVLTFRAFNPSESVTAEIAYNEFDGVSTTLSAAPLETYEFCAQTGTPTVTSGEANLSDLGACIPILPDLGPCACRTFQIANQDLFGPNVPRYYSYIDCDGNFIEGYLSPNEFVDVTGCASSVIVDYGEMSYGYTGYPVDFGTIGFDDRVTTIIGNYEAKSNVAPPANGPNVFWTDSNGDSQFATMNPLTIRQFDNVKVGTLYAPVPRWRLTFLGEV